ncbi:hypothetical protein Hypma_013180 [Hypsizygus marmoreus]|uniref:Uncharacterized protein n=1 Tax=Hypsizygus marmoreus TaxID=39966 RepID=A0A369JJ57_HYPMA|nr:hypothetical protein Hypma_013180 [Hypsizygus marmoreus]
MFLVQVVWFWNWGCLHSPRSLWQSALVEDCMQAVPISFNIRSRTSLVIEHNLPSSLPVLRPPQMKTELFHLKASDGIPKRISRDIFEPTPILDRHFQAHIN